MSSGFRYEKENIELRRSKVLELLAKGYSQKEIAEKLGVSPGLISLDNQYVHEKSKKDMECHFQVHLPYLYAKSMAGINATLKKASEMLDEAKDPKVKIEIMKLQMELWKSVMSMATDGGLLERIMKGIKERDKDNEKPSELHDEKNASIATNTEEETEEKPTEKEE